MATIDTHASPTSVNRFMSDVALISFRFVIFVFLEVNLRVAASAIAKIPVVLTRHKHRRTPL
jgi:hypothetical protein